jgi:hypothetical protein
MGGTLAVVGFMVVEGLLLGRAMVISTGRGGRSISKQLARASSLPPACWPRPRWAVCRAAPPSWFHHALLPAMQIRL